MPCWSVLRIYLLTAESLYWQGCLADSASVFIVSLLPVLARLCGGFPFSFNDLRYIFAGFCVVF